MTKKGSNAILKISLEVNTLNLLQNGNLPKDHMKNWLFMELMTISFPFGHSLLMANGHRDTLPMEMTYIRMLYVLKRICRPG